MLCSLVLVLISITYVTPEAIFVRVDPQHVPPFFNAAITCAEKTGIDSNTMQKVMDFKFEENDQVKKFMYCLTKDSGYGDSKGYLVKEKIVKLIGNHPLKREFLSAIDECNKLKGKNDYDTLFKTINCFRNTSPILFKI